MEKTSRETKKTKKEKTFKIKYLLLNVICGTEWTQLRTVHCPEAMISG